MCFDVKLRTRGNVQNPPSLPEFEQNTSHFAMDEVVLSYLLANRIEAERKSRAQQVMAFAQAISLIARSFVHRGYYGRSTCRPVPSCGPKPEHPDSWPRGLHNSIKIYMRYAILDSYEGTPRNVRNYSDPQVLLGDGSQQQHTCREPCDMGVLGFRA